MSRAAQISGATPPPRTEENSRPEGDAGVAVAAAEQLREVAHLHADVPWPARTKPMTIATMIGDVRAGVERDEGRYRAAARGRPGSPGTRACGRPVRQRCRSRYAAMPPQVAPIEQHLGHERGVDADDGDQVRGHEHLVGVRLRADADVHEETRSMGLRAVLGRPPSTRRLGLRVLLLEFLRRPGSRPSLRRMTTAPTVTKRLLPKTTRQPQDIRASSGSVCASDPGEGAEYGAEGGADHDERGEPAAPCRPARSR